MLRRSAAGYSASFDTKYFSGPVPSMPPPLVSCSADVAAWLHAVPMLKQAIDLAQPGEERDIQQLMIRDNNFGGIARSTDYYVCDIEYANREGRFDLIGVRWLSTTAARKRQRNHRLVLGELKFGDNALDGKAGVHAHIRGASDFLAAPGSLDALKAEMVTVFNQKRTLGLVDCGKDLLGFSDEPPILLLVFVNHDPDKSRLREILRTLPPSPHAELRIATGGLMGYGLYDPAIHSVDEAMTRFADRI